MNAEEIKSYLGKRVQLDYLTGAGPHAEGTLIGYYDSPTVVIETDDGRQIPWLASLVSVAEAPLVLPTEPTWGIAVMQDDGPMVGNWRTAHYVPTDFQCDDHGTYQTSEVADFIPLTDEQVARIEAAR